MKKILMILCLIALVGCASEKPMPQQVLIERPIVNTCNNCTRSYTVRTPVQVVYKNNLRIFCGKYFFNLRKNIFIYKFDP